MICAERLMFEAHTDEEKGRRSIGGSHRAGSVTILGARLFMVGGSGQRRAARVKCPARHLWMSRAPRHQHERTASPKLSALSRATPGHRVRALAVLDTRGTLLGPHLRPTAADGRCREMDWARAEIPGAGKGLIL